MKKFMIRWTASGYQVEFRCLIVAESLEEAKQIWQNYVKNNSEIQYSWEKAESAVQRHYGGYIVWKDMGESNKIKGCYEKENVNIFEGSDHLRD